MNGMRWVPKMSIERDIAVLQLYNQRAAELNDSSFLHHVRSSPATSFNFAIKPFRVVSHHQPSNEALKAFVLTFRLFIQDRDGLSFRAITKLLTNSAIESSLKQEIVEIRDEVYEYLGENSPFVIYGNPILRRELLQTWMYGEIAHVNQKERAVLRQWTLTDDLRPLFQHEFETILIHLTQAVFWVRQVNIRAINMLS